MRNSRAVVLFVFVMAFVGWLVPLCLGQQAADSGQATPAVSGSGTADRIALWKNSTTLGNSALFESGTNVGIGTTAPAAKLEVNGNAQVDGNFSLSGSILLNGVGQLIWAPNDASGNFSVGLGALPSSTTGTQNTALGDSSLAANTTGFYNTASGWGALAANTTGSGNTASGWGALAANTTGFGNTASGEGALQLNTTGTFNTASGVLALGVNTTGTFNTATGANALDSNTTGIYNTASGTGAMFANITGNYNTATGQNALSNNTTGNYNTAIGVGALANSTTGGNNIDVGAFAGWYVTSTSNNIHIGNQGTATDSGTIRIGCSSNCPDLAPPHTSAFIAGIYGVNTSGIPVYINSDGQLGTVSSSRRYKEDIKDMDSASDGLMRLRPVTFRYKKAFGDGSKPIQFGLIAEEVAEVYPDLVARSADGQVESVRYQLLDPMLLNELQKQNSTITAQKEQIRAQGEQARAQEQRIGSLEERLSKLEAALSGTSVTASTR